MAIQHGKLIKEECSNCKSINGYKINAEIAGYIATRFFENGSYHRVNIGGAPILKVGTGMHDSNLLINPEAQIDADLIKSKIGLKFSRYGPPEWMLGQNNYIIDLCGKNSKQVAKEIISNYPEIILSQDDRIIRLRKNPNNPRDKNEYDSTPKPGNGRLDKTDMPVFYGSNDLDIIIHECRVQNTDKLFFATFRPSNELKLINLSTVLPHDKNAYESMDIAINQLFNSGEGAYIACRELSTRIKELGYDGLLYPSYFSPLKYGVDINPVQFGIPLRRLPENKDYFQNITAVNIALFGYPVKEEKLTLLGINNLTMKQIDYKYDCGPMNYAM